MRVDLVGWEDKMVNRLQLREGSSGEGRGLKDEEKESKRSGRLLWGSRSGGDGAAKLSLIP